MAWGRDESSVRIGDIFHVNLEQKIRPHDMETLEETEQTVEEVVGREGGGELDGVENG